MIQQTHDDAAAARNPPDAAPIEQGSRGLGLLAARRQDRWLAAIASRFQRVEAARAEMLARHREERDQLDRDNADRYEQELNRCRQDRRAMLDSWDSSVEEVVARYESETLEARRQKKQRVAELRKQRKEQVEAEERWFDEQTHRVRAEYARDKPRAAAIQQQEHTAIAKRLARVQGIVDRASEIAMRRLGGPEAVAPLIHPPLEVPTGQPSAVTTDPSEPQPSSIKDCLHQLETLAHQAAERSRSLNDGWPVKFVESYYLVVLMLGVGLVWCGLIYLVGPTHLMLWMLGAIPLAIIAAMATHTAMAIPVRRQTSERYPDIARMGARAVAVAKAGRAASVARANALAAHLRRTRDAALDEIRTQHEQKMREIRDRATSMQQRLTAELESETRSVEQTFRASYSQIQREMFATATSTAEELANRLGAIDHENHKSSEALADAHRQQLEALERRVDQGVRRALERGTRTTERARRRYPRWESIEEDATASSDMSLRWLPLGWMETGPHLSSITSVPGPSVLPVTLPREVYSAAIVDCHPEQMSTAAEWLRGVLWRALAGVRPGQLRLTLLDPVGRGQNFSSLVALADYDPQLVNHRAWSAPAQIAHRLGELTSHIEDVLQTCLRDRYAALEDFNRDAGALAEPYRLVAAFGLPSGLTHESVEAIRALIHSGGRCGVFTILIRDMSQPWPPELPPLPEANVLPLRFCDQGRLWHASGDVLPRLAIAPLEAPPASALPRLAERIGTEAVALQHVEIPLDQCVPPEMHDQGDSAEGLRIPVGRQGVGRSLEIDLGHGMRQHVLVAGKTGSGKSTLLHSLITAAALLYPPDQLHLYLLDFKKGVEFKIYADGRLPHARVIGIESEREFGRSVLQRLDEELQQRGELFRAQGVQELGEYRRQGRTPMPRILLVVDEFQELFVRDDRLAQECTMLLDRLVRQGRSFGIHVVLSSQSLAGAYSLPRATLGQMAIRIALQCSESDAALILSDDNTAARLLSRPGEAIYNDAGGLVEGNQPFQVARVAPETGRQWIAQLAERHADAADAYGPAVVFEGNRPARWTPRLATSALEGPEATAAATTAAGLLGEGVRIGPPATLAFSAATGRNLLCVADPEATASVLAAWIPTCVADVQRRTGTRPKILILDGQRSGESEFALGKWLDEAGVEVQSVRPRDAEAVLVEMANGLEPPAEESIEVGRAPTFVIIRALERFRELRQDDSFGFSLDGAPGAGGATALQTLLRDGPQSGVHVILTCGGPESLARWLPRGSHHDLELRILGRASANDSAQLIESPDAADLTPATLLFYDDANGGLEKFRILSIPGAEKVRRWLESLG